jgi:molybdenum cofactor cytidylyltransferase
MEFGPCPTEQAAESILAHSIRWKEGGFRKGHRLSDADTAALLAAGVHSVIVARPGPDDMAEDAAAQTLAGLIAGAGLQASAAFTGRVNLYATVAGLTHFECNAIHQLNLLDESLTVATLPSWSAVHSGQMVATIKIIPFAVPRDMLAAAGTLLPRPPLRIAAFQPLKAGLIQTMLPGTRPSVLEKTEQVTSARLAELGSTLIQSVRVEHSEAAVADALTRMADVSLLLLVGASAVTDRRDVLPAGITAAGGRVIQFGMPVDPGNLILIAELAGRPVVGLPGCARSAKANGFDWVLQRLAARLPVGKTEIMRMGVGGLLAEVPTRPLPRQRASTLPRAPRIAALILAGGLSRRMGDNKLLQPLRGKPLLLHAVDTALASQCQAVHVVTGHQAEAVSALLVDRTVDVHFAADHAAGLSATLKAGLLALPADIDGVLVMQGDMPLLQSLTLDRVIAAWSRDERRLICRPSHAGQPGNPILWDIQFKAEMLNLSGDSGARGLLDRYAAELCIVPVDDAGVLIDIDTPDMLAALNATP